MVIIVEEKDLSDHKKANIISSLGKDTMFYSPENIAYVSSAAVIFVDIYYEALSFCLIKGIEIKFLYGNRLLSQLDISAIGLLQEDLL